MGIEVSASQGEDMWSQPDDLYWDPFDHTIHEDQHPLWKRMREEAPLYRNEEHDFWALTRFQDVVDTYVNWRDYSSARGDILEIIRGGQSEYSTANMISEDPPLHRLHRATVSRAFTPKAVQIIEDRVRSFATKAFDDQVGANSFDMVKDIGRNVAGTAIAGMLGIPDSDLPSVLDFIDMQMQVGTTLQLDERNAFDDLQEGQRDYFRDQIRRCRQDPRDDIMSGLATLEFVDEHGVRRMLTEEEVAGNVGLLTAGGYETMTRFAGWTGDVLAKFPEQRAKLVDRPELIPNAVDELLRFESPSHANARTTTRDLEWYGRTVPAGSVVLLIPGSAGRDWRAYPDPDTFDVERVFERHLAFGFGIHFCLGAALARLEGRIIMEELLARFPEWEVDRDNAEFVHAGSAVRGYSKLPITV
jgi:cytochrome P450